jgi:hypothetical protein
MAIAKTPNFCQYYTPFCKKQEIVTPVFTKNDTLAKKYTSSNLHGELVNPKNAITIGTPVT